VANLINIYQYSEKSADLPPDCH